MHPYDSVDRTLVYVSGQHDGNDSRGCCRNNDSCSLHVLTQAYSLVSMVEPASKTVKETGCCTRVALRCWRSAGDLPSDYARASGGRACRAC
jgi:hypothetical protein